MDMGYEAKWNVESVSLWFDGPLCAPLRMGEQVTADWWSDYVADPVVKRKQYTTGTSTRFQGLRDHTNWHQGRLWENGKIIDLLK